MFWGLICQPNKKYSKTVSTAFHVSQAVLDVNTITGDTDVQLILKSDKVDYILCILRKETVQVPLDLIFSEGDDISFRSVGGTVHLTGYLVDDHYPNMGDVESSDNEEEVPALVLSPKAQKKFKPTAPEQGSSSENENGSDGSHCEEGSDDDDDSDEVEEPAPKKTKQYNGPLQNGSSKKGDKHKENKYKKQQQKAPTERTLQGGVKIEDIRLGKGQEAKPGKKVQVYYEGRFKSNNKIFDKTNTGDGLKFVLGRGEVIKGWDVGLAGMKVGSKRRIVCPPNMAYGTKGSPPVIPPNSTLVFEVELRGVN